MKTTNEVLFTSQKILGSIAGRGNIHTNYGVNKNLAAIDAILAAARKTLNEDADIKCFMAWADGDEETDTIKAGRDKYFAVLAEEVDFVPHKFSAEKVTNDFRAEYMEPDELKRAEKMNADFAKFLSHFDAIME